jgi:hypothetical protein
VDVALVRTNVVHVLVDRHHMQQTGNDIGETLAILLFG